MLLHSKITGTGQPFLILHGLFGSSDNWYSFSKQISNKFQVHLIDLRNHGRSFQSENMHNDIMSEDVNYYIKHNNLNNILLMGHSLGGRVAMQLASKFGFCLDKLIIVDICNKEYSLEGVNNIINMLDNLDLSCFKSRQEIYNILYDFSKDDKMSQFLVKNLYRNNDNKFIFRFDLNSIKKNISSFGELQENQIINSESFFIKGEKSNYIKKEDFFIIKKQFPKSKIIEIQNAYHWPHVDNPDAFLKEIKKIICY